MATSDPETIRTGDWLLRRAQKGLEYATIGLIIPVALLHYGQLPFASWSIVAIFVSMALWGSVEGIILLGQRYGFVGTKLFPNSSTQSAPENLAEPTFREPVRITRDAADAVELNSGAPVPSRKPARVVHVPQKGAVHYRIVEAEDRRE